MSAYSAPPHPLESEDERRTRALRAIWASLKRLAARNMVLVCCPHCGIDLLTNPEVQIRPSVFKGDIVLRATCDCGQRVVVCQEGAGLRLIPRQRLPPRP